VSIPLAYLGVVLIWTTTPITIKWSGVDVGFLFGISSRMLIASVVGIALVALMRKRLPLHRSALHAYIAVGIPLYTAMMAVYWGAQFIPSGLIAVIFGLTPLVTGLFAVYFLQEKSFTPFRVLGILLGVGGLAIIFSDSLALGVNAWMGLVGVLIAVVFHSLGTVWIKKVSTDISLLSMNTGGTTLATLLFSLTWLFSGASLPLHVPTQAAVSIVYLGVVGSVFGAILFYYALRHVDTGKMAMLTLITPVTALLVGNLFNGEVLAPTTLYGTALVVSGLAIYQWASEILRYLNSRVLPQ